MLVLPDIAWSRQCGKTHRKPVAQKKISEEKDHMATPVFTGNCSNLSALTGRLLFGKVVSTEPNMREIRRGVVFG